MNKSSISELVMASYIYINLFAALLFLLLVGSAESNWPFKKVHVTIANELGGDVDLLAHCWSMHDDLGNHNLPIHAFFGFHFRTDLIFETIFTCQFDWMNDAHKIVQHTIDIYRAGRDKCTNCSWIITPNGPCMHNFEAHSLNCHTWTDSTTLS